MATSTRPMVNVYEGSELVYREMNDDEFAEYQKLLDNPQPEPVVLPSAADLFIQAADAIEAATSLADIKAAFADLKNKLQPPAPTL